MTDSEKLDFVIGQVAACKSALMTFCEEAEFPEHLLKALRHGKEITIAKTLASSASEATISGIEEVNRPGNRGGPLG